MTELLNPFGAPKSLPILTPSDFVKRISSSEGVKLFMQSSEVRGAAGGGGGGEGRLRQIVSYTHHHYY